LHTKYPQKSLALWNRHFYASDYTLQYINKLHQMTTDFSSQSQYTLHKALRFLTKAKKSALKSNMLYYTQLIGHNSLDLLPYINAARQISIDSKFVAPMTTNTTNDLIRIAIICNNVYTKSFSIKKFGINSLLIIWNKMLRLFYGIRFFILKLILYAV